LPYQSPKTIRPKLPHILSKSDVSLFTFATNEYVLFSFIDEASKKRIKELQTKKIHPFPFLIRPTKSDACVFFNLANGTKNVQIGRLALKGGFGFSIGKDCTLVVDEVKQSAKWKNIGKYEYKIDLAYVISFGIEVNGNTVSKFLKDLVMYSLRNWGNRR
jgi:hypothetical protein